ncbi:MAG: uroporphyrinogen decarboxylase family protein [bacterium]
MNSKQRVYGAIRRTAIDRTPRFLWFHPSLLDEFGRRFGTSGFATEAAIGNDILQPWVSINQSMARAAAEGASFTDDFGITWTRQGYYNMVTRHPLMDAGLGQIEYYRMPDPHDPGRFTELEQLLASFGNDHFIGADVSGSIFEPAYHLRGMEDLLVEMTLREPEAGALLDKTMRFTTSAALESMRRGVDWVWLGDDVGTQSGMLISPLVWREILKPRLKTIVDAIHSVAPGTIIAYHSCGSIRPIIGDLAEIGIDVLNPLQPMATDMDNAAIKREFGNTLTFMAGIDTQDFLVSAKPEQARAETRRIVEVMGGNGGFIFAGSHTIQPDVPMANIEAMLETLDNQTI